MEGPCPGSGHHCEGQEGPEVQIKLKANKMKPHMAITNRGHPPWGHPPWANTQGLGQEQVP